MQSQTQELPERQLFLVPARPKKLNKTAKDGDDLPVDCALVGARQAGSSLESPKLPWLRRPGNLLRTGSCGCHGARLQNKSMQAQSSRLPAVAPELG